MKRTILPIVGISPAVQAALDDKANSADPFGLGAAFSFLPIFTDSTARATAAANEAVYVRIVGAGTFSSVACRVSTASGNISIGVFADTVVGGVHQPGARVATTGSVTCPASGNASALSLGGSVTVTHGSHWFGFVADNTTATFVTQQVTPLNDPAMYPGVCYAQSSAFPLPTAASSLTSAAKRIPLIRGV